MCFMATSTSSWTSAGALLLVNVLTGHVTTIDDSKNWGNTTCMTMHDGKLIVCTKENVIEVTSAELGAAYAKIRICDEEDALTKEASWLGQGEPPPKLGWYRRRQVRRALPRAGLGCMLWIPNSLELTTFGASQRRAGTARFLHIAWSTLEGRGPGL